MIRVTLHRPSLASRHLADGPLRACAGAQEDDERRETEDVSMMNVLNRAWEPAASRAAASAVVSLPPPATALAATAVSVTEDGVSFAEGGHSLAPTPPVALQSTADTASSLPPTPETQAAAAAHAGGRARCTAVDDVGANCWGVRCCGDASYTCRVKFPGVAHCRCLHQEAGG